jgi:polyketide cyclase/dehydrase/lipid transport protein
MWKWVLIVIGALVGLVALMAVIGLFLPKDHVASTGVVLHQSPDSIWKTMRDLAGQPGWWPDVLESRAVPDSAGREVWDQKMKNGFTMRSIVTVSTPPTRFVTLIDSPPGAAFGGSWTYEIEPIPEGTRVTITEDGWVANPIFRFLSRFVFGHHGTQIAYLTALGRKFGETVQPVRQ